MYEQSKVLVIQYVNGSGEGAHDDFSSLLRFPRTPRCLLSQTRSVLHGCRAEGHDGRSMYPPTNMKQRGAAHFIH